MQRKTNFATGKYMYVYDDVFYIYYLCINSKKGRFQLTY